MSFLVEVWKDLCLQFRRMTRLHLMWLSMSKHNVNVNSLFVSTASVGQGLHLATTTWSCWGLRQLLDVTWSRLNCLVWLDPTWSWENLHESADDVVSAGGKPEKVRQDRKKWKSLLEVSYQSRTSNTLRVLR